LGGCYSEDMITAGGHLGDYLLLRKIAQGGMGEIFLACHNRDEKAERLLVIKVLRPELASDQSFVEMLTDEANVIRNLDHPNIVSFHDFGSHDGSYYIVLEYIHGGPLQDVLAAHQRQNQKLDVAVSLFVAIQLCAALEYAHEASGEDGTTLKLIHRDVTPSNILISSDGGVKLTDFGLVRAKGRMTETMPGILKGRFGYMAPEVMKYEEIDARADLFAVGVLLYEMLAGEGPVADQSISNFASVMESKSYSAPSALNPHVPAQLDQIVLKALEPTPDDRWQSAHVLKKALEDLVTSWSKTWAEAAAGQSRLKQLMMLLNHDLAEPAISASAVQTLMRDAAARSMLEEGVIESTNSEWTEYTESDETLVRSASSPDLVGLQAGAQVPSAPAIIESIGDSSEDDTLGATVEQELEAMSHAVPVVRSVPVAAAHLFKADKIDVRASRMSILPVRRTVTQGGFADTVESLRLGDDANSIQEESLQKKEHLARLRDELSIRSAPPLDGWDIAFHSSFFASRGGDIILDIQRPKGAPGLAFLQVVDAEPPPGLFTVHAASTMRACLAQSASPSSGMAWANRLLLRPPARRESVSACYLQFDTAMSQLHYVNAGYPPPFFYQSNEGRLFSLAGSNEGLGTVEGAQFEHRKVPVASKDIILIVTTGLLEVKNKAKELFGWQRTQDRLNESVDELAEIIVQNVADAVLKHSEGVAPVRDWAVIVLKRK
jgi:serine/threonine protein kinase